MTWKFWVSFAAGYVVTEIMKYYCLRSGDGKN